MAFPAWELKSIFWAEFAPNAFFGVWPIPLRSHICPKCNWFSKSHRSCIFQSPRWLWFCIEINLSGTCHGVMDHSWTVCGPKSPSNMYCEVCNCCKCCKRHTFLRRRRLQWSLEFHNIPTLARDADLFWEKHLQFPSVSVGLSILA